MSDARRLEASELDAALPLLAAEGWDFELPEIERLHRLGGAVGAFAEGTLVGFLTFVDAAPVRWIGNVVVAPGARGLGTGAALVGVALESADVAGLYSVEKAVTLYERAGFVARGEAFAHRAQAAAPKRRVTAARGITAEDGAGIVKLDRDATGMDRTEMLRALVEAYADHVRVVRERNRVVAYGIAKTSKALTELGPIIAQTPQARDAVLDALLAATPGPHEATALGQNQGALAALAERGFERKFRVVPMWRGDAPAMRVSHVAAAAALEKG